MRPSDVESKRIADLEREVAREREARLKAEALAKRGHKDLSDRQRVIHLLQAITVAANEASTIEQAMRTAIEHICSHTGWKIGHLYLRAEDGTRELVSSRIWHIDDPARYEGFRTVTEAHRFAPGIGLPGRVLGSAHPEWLGEYVGDTASDPSFPRAALARNSGIKAGFAFPLLVGSEVVAVLEFFSEEPEEPDELFLDVMAQIGTQLGRVIERERAQQHIQEQIARLDALRAIDIAITASLDLRLTLSVFLEQVTALMRVDAAAVLLANPHQQTLEFTFGKGLRTRGLRERRVRLGRGPAGQAALQRRVLHVPDLRQQSGEFSNGNVLVEEGFVSYYAAPLVVKGRVEGVLELYHRSPRAASQNEIEFLEALAGQAAIAIDNALMFERLQRSNIELMLAYDATIEGWSRALDLRDHETEGHTQRVTEMTINLALLMEIPEADLVNVRRGALLHDIGKMGVPDSILHKPEPLTDEEWAAMRLHPVYAYEMLSPIEFLRPAIAIPYCHHEKWDGTGYPRGLSGEQIPLEARIFAVVDVWDALRNDRPYKKAWPEAKSREYITEQSGKHFDPRVAELFLQTLPSMSGGDTREYLRAA